MYSCFDSITGRFVNIGTDNRQALNDLIRGKLPPCIVALVGWLVGWGLTALLTQNRSYRACKFVGIFYSRPGKKLATAGQSHTNTMDNHTVNKS